MPLKISKYPSSPALAVMLQASANTSRRKVPRNDPQIEIVTYLIQDNHGKKYYVDYFDPHGYYKIGENVCIPIYIKPYQRKTGELGYTIYIQKPSSQTVRGEHF